MKISTRRRGDNGKIEPNHIRLSPSRGGTYKTLLGGAVGASVDRGQNTVTAHEHHSTNNSLRDVILAAQDGLVTMLGIALGVVAAGGPTHVLFATVTSSAITQSISMRSPASN